MSGERGYSEWSPKPEAAHWVARAKQVLSAYRAEWPLSNRQLFYRLVAEHGYDKTEKAYDRLTQYVSRTRRSEGPDSPLWGAIRDGGLGTAVQAVYYEDADDFHENVKAWAAAMKLDRQRGQDKVIELWCEAGGMLPILRSIAAPYSCQANTGGGYDSVTAKHQLALRVLGRARVGLPTLILHVGDFDPSGEDMCEVLREDAGDMAASQVLRALIREYRLATTEDWPGEAPWEAVSVLAEDEGDRDAAANEVWRFCQRWLTVERVALTGEQVVDRNVITAPPKKSDSRMAGFVRNNWEIVEALGTEDISAQLEALTPAELRELVIGVIEEHMDMGVYRELLEGEEREAREELVERYANA